ncbi:hypothetical protein AP1H75_10560 [Apilactobacillus apinorum]
MVFFILHTISLNPNWYNGIVRQSLNYDYKNAINFIKRGSVDDNLQTRQCRQKALLFGCA